MRATGPFLMKLEGFKFAKHGYACCTTRPTLGRTVLFLAMTTMRGIIILAPSHANVYRHRTLRPGLILRVGVATTVLLNLLKLDCLDRTHWQLQSRITIVMHLLGASRLEFPWFPDPPAVL
jgi:hypothetical protein